MTAGIKLKEDEVKEILKKHGLTMVDGEVYKNSHTKMTLIDASGYKYFSQIEILRKQGTRRFSVYNKYTIYNIELWLTKNTKGIKMEEGQTFYKITKNMSFICERHGTFDTPFRALMLSKNCPYCTGRRVCATNNVAYIRSDLIKFFKNKDDAYSNTVGTHNECNFICDKCGFEKVMKVYTLVTYGFSCPYCSDGIPLGEKFIRNLLFELDISFTPQYSPDWAKNKRYDFYIPSLNMIIETHGEQHYRYTGRGRSLNEEQENDILKENLAKTNGIENYIIIDTRDMSCEIFIYNIKSSISKYIHLDNIDLKNIFEKSQKSIVFIVGELWNNNELYSAKEIAKLLNIDRSTVIEYLKKCNYIGFCTYNNKEIVRRKTIKRRNKNYKPVICIETGVIYNTRQDAEDQNGIKAGRLWSCLTGKTKTHDGLRWEYI